MSEQQAFVDDRVAYSVIKQVKNSAVENTSCSENKMESKASNIPIYTMVDKPKKAKQTINPILSATDDASTGMCDDVITGAKMNSVVDTSKKAEQTKYSTDTSAVMYDVPTGNLTKQREEIVSNDTYSSLAFHHDYTPTKDGPKKEQHLIITSTGIFRILTLACFLIFFITVAAAFAILFSQLNALKHTVHNMDCDKDNVSETLELLTSIKEINSIKKLVENMQLYQHNKSKNYYQYQQNRTTENDILLLQNLFSIFVSLGRNASFPAPSCCFILHHSPLPSSGFYWIGSVGAAINFFCNMSYCEGSISGWKRVALLDMTNKNVSCPLNLTSSIFQGNIYCGLQNSKPSCSSVYFPINTTYSNVYGTIRGYGTGSLDGFIAVNDINLDGIYLDGVSLTYKEQENRTHIWSFVARAFCGMNNPCPTKDLPSFVNTSFTCDIRGTLWDDNPCGLTTSPWFFKQLPEPTTSDIEMRLCLNDEDTDENIWISYIELYIQ